MTLITQPLPHVPERIFFTAATPGLDRRLRLRQHLLPTRTAPLLIQIPLFPVLLRNVRVPASDHPAHEDTAALRVGEHAFTRPQQRASGTQYPSLLLPNQCIFDRFPGERRVPQAWPCRCRLVPGLLADTENH